MGQLEKQNRQKTRRKNLRKIVLATIATAGIMSIAVTAPNVLGAMGKLGLLPSKREKEFIHRSRQRLLQRGFLIYRHGNLTLTPKGEKELRKLELQDFKLKKPKRWDNKWRVLIFDIPERRRTLRDKIRRTLISIGFEPLQQSVWIYPYDCEDLITLLKSDFEVGKNLLYLIVDSLEYDVSFRKKFSLPLR